MAWSEAEVVVCRIHPNQKPQPGICPSCLRDRLSRIAGNSRIFNKTTSFPASPVYYYYFSSAASSSAAASPPSHSRRHHRVASDVIDSIYMAISGGSHGLKKSRSMACAPRNGELIRDNHKKKKGGFWNKLMIRYSLKKV